MSPAVPFDDPLAAPARHEVLTPEGVTLDLSVARAGDRLAAFAWDVFLLLLANLAVFLLAGIAFGVALRSPGMLGAFALVFFFLTRNFYFAWFELRWQGSTPGKRKIGIRVIDARGGPLRPEAVLARNFTREVEVLLPIGLVLSPGALWPGLPTPLRLLALLWVIGLALFPLFNRSRRRIGDFVAGTRVVREPRAALLPVLTKAGGGIAFTAEQLDVYGIYELEVLEEVLRTADLPGGAHAVETVAAKIRSRIGWSPSGAPPDPRAFLHAFYAAQRARLERRLLFGDRRSRKR